MSEDEARILESHLKSNSDDRKEAIKEEFEFLNSVAHKIQVGKGISQAQRKASPTPTISSRDGMEKICQLMRPLPENAKELDQIMKLCPSTEEEPLKQGEIWCLADTGSTLHALDVEKELPEYRHLVQTVPKHKRGRGAECANGGRLPVNGDVRLKGMIDGELYTIPFKDMRVSMPIASMPQTVANGNDLMITPDGAKIRCRKTGHEIKLHERKGVYFFKMSLLPPDQQPKNSKRIDVGFQRQA